LQLLRREGHAADIVERRLPRCFVTRDFLGLFDVLAVRADSPGVLGVQSTSAANHASRVRNLLEAPALRVWIGAGNGAEVITWRKAGGRWRCRRQALTLADLGAAAV
jgi:hypothetical protein